jgi:hypothetical protein
VKVTKNNDHYFWQLFPRCCRELKNPYFLWIGKAAKNKKIPYFQIIFGSFCVGRLK